MSTKMYDLYRYSNDIFTLWDWLPRMRERYIACVIEGLTAFSVEKLDLYSVLLHDTKQGLRSPFNIEASVIVYCDREQLYVQFFGIESFGVFAQLHQEFQEFTDCSYQNQSDRPEDVEEQEWEERRQLVDRLLAGDWQDRPGHAGLVYVLADISDAWMIAAWTAENYRGNA